MKNIFTLSITNLYFARGGTKNIIGGSNNPIS